MIDNLLNGSNGNHDSHIPCPFCAEYSVIKECLTEAAIYDGQSSLDVLQILVAELKMWRAKDDYEKKTKAAIAAMVEQKIKNGFQVGGEIS
jgi:hypothetical protein